jgi:hypothetical protein
MTAEADTETEAEPGAETLPGPEDRRGKGEREQGGGTGLTLDRDLVGLVHSCMSASKLGAAEHGFKMHATKEDAKTGSGTEQEGEAIVRERRRRTVGGVDGDVVEGAYDEDERRRLRVMGGHGCGFDRIGLVCCGWTGGCVCGCD